MPDPEPFSNVHRHQFEVTEEVIDGNGHVNNVAYVQWMQDVAIRHFDSLGGTDLMDAHGAAWVARSHHIEYLRPVFAGEHLELRTWVVDMERATSRRGYEFVRLTDGAMVANGETHWVFVDAARGRPKRIPEEMKRRLQENARRVGG